MGIEVITILLFFCLLGLLLLGLPVAFGLGGTAVIFGLLLWGPESLLTIELAVLSNMRTIIFCALPLFVFMGIILEISGIADELYNVMYKWFGPVRGGLAMGTVCICTLFAAMAGISAAATVTMGLIALPSMLSRGYDKRIAVGCIAAGGALGVLIPPSVLMVLYAFVAGESVGRLFAGGIIPGLILSFLFILYIGIRSYFQPELGPSLPAEERASWKEKFVALKSIFLPIFLVILVLGTIFTGIATPTEAAAIGGCGAMICAIILRKFGWQVLKNACYRTISVSGMLMWIVSGATAFSTIYTALGATELISGIVIKLEVSPIIVIIMMQVILFILGCFLDPTGIIMICIPVFVPIIKALGYDAVWFGVLFVVNMEMAYLTPPYGANLFYLKGVVPEGVSMGDIYNAIIPFVFLQALGLVIVIIFPNVVLWIPNLLFGK